MPAAPSALNRAFDPASLPNAVANALWRGTEMGSGMAEVHPTGFAELDAQLPGGGWPLRSTTEILQPQPSLAEWRLLAPSLKRIAADGGAVLVVGPPKVPHMAGLMQSGLDPHTFTWIDARTPAERLWVTEQLVKSNAGGAVLSWLPQARAEQLRRLQVHAGSCEGLVFLFRPEAAQFEASPAPLRVMATLDGDWGLKVRVFKRKGALQDEPVSIFSIPEMLADVLTPRQLRPAPTAPVPEVHHARPVGSPAPEPEPFRLRAVS